MKNLPLISVIIPVCNGEKFLPSCLDAVFASDYLRFEVITVDDGSTDASAEIARLKGATVLSTDKPRSGPGAARNIAAEKAQGEILVFTDADVVLKKDALSAIVARFNNKKEISALFGSYDNAPAEKNFLSQYRNLLHHFVHQNSNPDASTFWAGLGAIRRDVFRKAGGFDTEKFSVPSIEDIELGVRLKSGGQKILLDRNIQGKHLKKWTVKSVLYTDIFCRALPWSKLIIISQGLINDMNLKTSDRLSAILTGICVLLVPVAFFYPLLIAAITAVLILILILNRKIFGFFLRTKGILFTVAAFPWQLLYFFYSGAVFVLCWLRYGLPQLFGMPKKSNINAIR